MNEDDAREHEAREHDKDLPPPTLTERALRRVLRQVAADTETPIDKDTLAGMLQRAGGLEETDEDLDDTERAQELAYRAMDAETKPKASALCDEALALDPRNVEALRIRAELEAKSPGERIKKLSLAVKAGESVLGSTFFEENRGAFWGVLETRPYMRARTALAEALVSDGQLDRAREHYAELLELNPNDNQANRMALLSLLLRSGDAPAARALSDRFEEDFAAMEWGRVLLCWLEEDEEAAHTALCKAAERNAHVVAHLLRDTELPVEPGSHYSPGLSSEVPVVMQYLRPALDEHPDFMPWLRESLEGWDFQRGREWVERHEEARGEPAPEWAVGFFGLAVKARGGLELRAGKAPSKRDIAWYRLMAEAPELRAADAPSFGYVPCAAATVLGGIPSAENAQLLVDLVVQLERDDDVMGDFMGSLENALEDMGTKAVEPVLAALDEGHVGSDGFSWLLDTLARAGVRDERIFAHLLTALPHAPEAVAGWMADYGDEAGLPLLDAALEGVLARAGDDLLPHAGDIAGLCEAIETLGGILSPRQKQARASLSRIRMPENLSSGRQLLPARHGNGSAPDPSRGPLRAGKQPGRNEPCWCGSGTKYKRCHLQKDEESAGR